MRSRCCPCVCIPRIVARQRLSKSTRIVAKQRLGKNHLIVARLGRNVTAVTNTHATIEELFDASFSMSYQGKYAISSSQNFLFTLEHVSTVIWPSSGKYLYTHTQIVELFLRG
jgi:hypothetical protein